MYFDRNISEKGSYLSCVTTDEFYFKNVYLQSVQYLNFRFGIKNDMTTLATDQKLICI